MNGRTYDSSGVEKDKNTRMTFETKPTNDNNSLWLNFYEGPGDFACASFYMSEAEIEAMIAYLRANLCNLQRAKMIEEEARIKGIRRYKARETHIEDFE